jgi:hypothetical protein
MATKEDVIAEQSAAHAVFHEAVTEEGMQCPATWAIYADANRADQLGLGPTEDEAWERALDRLANRAAAVAAAAEPGVDEQAAEIGDYLQEIYNTIWGNWYAGIDEAEPAAFDVQFTDGTDGYNPDTHTLVLFISEGNRDEILADRDAEFDLFSHPATWHGWYTVLVHEMIHEYQYRSMNNAVTVEGQSLMDNYPKHWNGPGHGAGFYSAIVSRAAYFGVQNIPQFCHIL